MGAKLPGGILLNGPPGTGKTLIAKAIAGEAGVPFLYASGSQFDEMYVGVGAKRMRKLFKEAREQAPCIIFIDEIDAVAGKRSGNGAGDDSRSRMTINQLLQEMDGLKENENLIVIGATNFKQYLDSAILRPGIVRSYGYFIFVFQSKELKKAVSIWLLMFQRQISRDGKKSWSIISRKLSTSLI